MFKKSLIFMFFVATIMQISFVCAGVKKISYQGKLMDNTGNPVDTAGNTISVTFRIYDDANKEVSAQTQGVVVDKGLFNVSLDNLDSLDFSKQYSLGIQVAGDENEMTPRQKLGSSAYALGSLGDFNVGGNQSIGGGKLSIITPSDGYGLSLNNRFGLNSDGSFHKYASLEQSGAYGVLNLYGTGENNPRIHLNARGNSYINPDFNGNVGIGTNNPISKLHVSSKSSEKGVLRVSSQAETDQYIDIKSPKSNSNGNAEVTSRYGLNIEADSARAYQGGMNFIVDGTNAMYIKPNGGNVGIGTNNPTAKLEVNGKVNAGSFGQTISYGQKNNFTMSITIPASWRGFIKVFERMGGNCGHKAETYDFDSDHDRLTATLLKSAHTGYSPFTVTFIDGWGSHTMNIVVTGRSDDPNITVDFIPVSRCDSTAFNYTIS